MKKLLLPMLAVLFALGFSAFKIPEKIKHTDPLWYFTGTSTDDHSNQSLYEPLDDQDVEAECPGSSEVRCVIEAPVDGMTGKPNLASITNFVSYKP